MAQPALIKWREGNGWLVLSGGGDFRQDETLEIDTQVLSRTVSLNPLVYVSANADSGDDYLAYLQDLGARTGYQVDLLSESSASVMEQLKESGIIILADTPLLEQVSPILLRDLRSTLADALEEGATLYAQGRMASLFGEWTPAPLIGLEAGLAWLPNALILSPYLPDSQKLPNLLKDYIPTAYGIGIGKGSALALAPNQGGLEVWGEPQITVILGQQLSAYE